MIMKIATARKIKRFIVEIFKWKVRQSGKIKAGADQQTR
jgi:hypothetical protein